MVGIANAMLMAITERFREIATMKCLGATDGFILTQFLMESGIQGAFGGAAGMVLGLFLSLLKGGWLYGGHLLWYMPWIGLAVAGALCVLAGLLLATLASVYPSWKASRMAPMEAMRVE
jgi:ABC-type antimicrobial peptide transport system permease subunit